MEELPTGKINESTQKFCKIEVMATNTNESLERYIEFNSVLRLRHRSFVSRQMSTW